MERKIAKLLALTGVAVSAAVALTPLTSYAVASSCDLSKATTTGVEDLTTGGCAGAVTGAKKVAVNVESSLSIDASSGTTINMTPHVLGTGAISATVTSTHPYTISLSSTQPNLIKTDNNNLNIPAKSSFTKDDNGWGIKKNGEESYTALTNAPTVYYTGAEPAYPTGKETKFEVGVAVNEQTTPGTYQTDVTVTAATQI